MTYTTKSIVCNTLKVYMENKTSKVFFFIFIYIDVTATTEALHIIVGTYYINRSRYLSCSYSRCITSMFIPINPFKQKPRMKFIHNTYIYYVGTPLMYTHYTHTQSILSSSPTSVGIHYSVQ